MKKLMALVLMAMSGAAAGAESHALYGGGSLLRADYRNSFQDANGIPGFSVDRTDQGFKLFGGTELNRFVAVELGYLDGLQFGQDYRDAFGSDRTDVDASAFTLSVVGRVSISDRLELFGKAGFGLWKLEAINTISSPPTITVTQESLSGNGAAYGAGVDFKITDHLAVRGEYEVIEIISETELRVTSVGVGWKF